MTRFIIAFVLCALGVGALLYGAAVAALCPLTRPAPSLEQQQARTNAAHNPKVMSCLLRSAGNASWPIASATKPRCRHDS